MSEKSTVSSRRCPPKRSCAGFLNEALDQGGLQILPKGRTQLGLFAAFGRQGGCEGGEGDDQRTEHGGHDFEQNLRARKEQVGDDRVAHKEHQGAHTHHPGSALAHPPQLQEREQAAEGRYYDEGGQGARFLD